MTEHGAKKKSDASVALVRKLMGMPPSQPDPKTIVKGWQA